MAGAGLYWSVAYEYEDRWSPFVYVGGFDSPAVVVHDVGEGK